MNQRFLSGLFDTSLTSWIVEIGIVRCDVKVCKVIPFFYSAADWFSSIIVFNAFCSRFLRIVLYGSMIMVCNHQPSFLSPFLYMTDMIPVLEVTSMVPSFPQES